MSHVYSKSVWVDVGASNNLWGAQALLTREKLASVKLLGAPFAGGTMPVPVYSVELGREAGRVERIEMRGPELWAELSVEEAALAVPGSHAEGLYVIEPEQIRIFAVVLTNKPRGVMSRVLAEYMQGRRS